MFKIVDKQNLADSVSLFKIEAPEIAKKRKAGQFVVLRIDEKGERFPLTLAESDPKSGTITIVAQAIGKSTNYLNSLKAGDSILDIVGPLGKPTHIEKYGTVVCVGGGVGIAEVYPIAKALKEAGNKVISILGARDKSLIIFEDQIKSISDEVYVTTDNGSYGEKGFVTYPLKRLIDSRKIDFVLAVGPTIMMKVVADATKEKNVKTFVSLNTIMLDATGMCGVCRVTVGGKSQLACVDGPEFDGHLVDFDELMKRQKIYLTEEKQSLDLFLAHKGKRCYE